MYDGRNDGTGSRDVDLRNRGHSVDRAASRVHRCTSEKMTASHLWKEESLMND